MKTTSKLVRAWVLLLACSVLLGGCWGRKFVQMPRETISTSTKVDSLLRENAYLQRRVYRVEKALEEQQQFDRSFNAQLKLDLEELKDQINALQQALEDAGYASAYRYERTPSAGRIDTGGIPGTGEERAPLEGMGESGMPGDSAVVDTVEAFGDTTRTGVGSTGIPPVPGGSVPPPDEIHRQIYLDFSRGDYQLALEESDLFLDAYSDHPLGEEVRFIRGECFIEQQKYFDALNEFALILQNYPRGKKAPAVLLRMAISYEKIGEEEIAAGVVKRLRKEYPYSEEAAIAEERFRDLLEE